MLSALRYFRIVPVVPPLFVGGFVLAVLLATIQLAGDPSSGIFVLTPVLKLQLLAASSGFQLPARRGYYDLLFTSGTPRWQIAVAHCLASMTPGCAAWVCVALLELTASHGARFASGAAGTCAAFLAWSLIGWAFAVFTSRHAATVVWLVIMGVPAIARLSPIEWLGLPASEFPPFALALMYASAAVPFVVALVSVIRGTTPLEASQ